MASVTCFWYLPSGVPTAFTADGPLSLRRPVMRVACFSGRYADAGVSGRGRVTSGGAVGPTCGGGVASTSLVSRNGGGGVEVNIASFSGSGVDAGAGVVTGVGAGVAEAFGGAVGAVVGIGVACCGGGV